MPIETSHPDIYLLFIYIYGSGIFWRRKYGVGRIIPRQWIGFLIPVQNRDSATLIPIKHHLILPGSIAWSDMWAAYNGLQAPSYLHGTVNHTLILVDHQTGVTNLFKKFKNNLFRTKTLKCTKIYK